MNAVFETVAPVFALIALGFGAGLSGYMRADDVKVLNRFVVGFALPALLFRLMVTADLPAASPWLLWSVFYGAMAIVWLLTVFLSRSFTVLAPAGGSAAAIAATFGNLVLMGIPLALGHFGPAATRPMALLISVHAVVNWLAASLLAEWSSRQRQVPLTRMFVRLGRDLALNPIIAPLVLGALWGLTGFGLHPVVDETMAFLARAAVPSALFMLGLTLSGYSLTGQFGVVALLIALKMVVMPLVAWALVSLVVPLDPLEAKIVILFAALPGGVNAYLFASRYNVAVAPVSGAIAIGTGLAIVTTSLLLSVL
jgi:predicted permease